MGLGISRKIEQAVTITIPDGRRIGIRVDGWHPRNGVRLYFEADRDIVIHRDEVQRQVDEQDRQARAMLEEAKREDERRSGRDRR